MRRLLAGLAGLCCAAMLVAPAEASAAADIGDSSFPVDEVTQLEVHVRADCRTAVRQCTFNASANLRTPEGVTGFPSDLWSRQTTIVRSSNRSIYPETQVNAPFTKVFNSGDERQITTIYFGGGPPERFQIDGTTQLLDRRTGQPSTDSDIIVCVKFQVVFGGHNITSPSTCAQTTFS